MSASTATFPCPFCGKRMGVAVDFLGKNVRCPHCKQVVLAPAAANPAAAAQPKPAPQSVQQPRPQPVNAKVNPVASAAPTATPPAPRVQQPAVMDEEFEHTFKIEHKESADSILSEPGESEDEIFGSPGSNRAPIPTLPELPPPPPTPLEPTLPVLQQPTAAPVPAPVAPAHASLNPFAFEDDQPPPPVSAAPQPVVAQPLVATPLSRAVAAIPLPVPIPVLAPVQPGARRGRATRGQPAATDGAGVSMKVFLALAGYALVMTLLAVYGLFFK